MRRHHSHSVARRSRGERPRSPQTEGTHTSFGKGPKNMISRRWKHAASAATLAVCLAAPLWHAAAQTADNTSRNKEQAQTADKQSNAKSDVETTAKIRKEIMADKGLSTYAHNVKIITANGAVTLKGPVTSDTERQRVAQLAADVVSADKVSNELTVK